MGGEAVDGRFVRAPAYGAVRGEYGYQTGPLINGQSSRENCINWDRFFTVTGEERRQLISYYTIARQNGDLPIPTNLISDNLLGWPATGNPHFLGANGFNLPETTDGLAPFSIRTRTVVMIRPSAITPCFAVKRPHGAYSILPILMAMV